MKSLTITARQFGFSVSAYGFSAGISGLLTAGFADRVDRKKLLLLFYLGFLAGTFLCAVASSYQFLVFARIVTGIFGGVIGSVSMTIVTDVFPLNKRGRALGVMQMSFAACQVLGIPAALYLANSWNWHAPFFMILMFDAMIFICGFILLRPVTDHLTDKKRQDIFRVYRGILSNRKYQLGFVLTALVYIDAYLIQPFASPYLINNLRVSNLQLPFVYLCSGLAAIIIMPLIGIFSDKMDKSRLFYLGSTWTIIILLLYTNLPVVALWVIITIYILLLSGVLSQIVPASAIISDIPSSDNRGGFIIINFCLQQFAGGAAAAAAGLIITQNRNHQLENFNLLGYISFVIIVISMWLMRNLIGPIKHTKENGVDCHIGLKSD